MTIRSLLSILADGKFHSGNELGEVLGISRSAIWKHMRRLEEDGLEIYSVKGRGYRVPGGFTLFDPDVIRHALKPEASSQLQGIDLQLTIPSTNALAIKESQHQDCHGRLYLAEQQTHGRGRRGRSWVSPFARNLYFSLVWRFEQGAAALEGLSLLVGLAMVKSTQTLGIQGIELKWPNDLLCQGRKLAGILLEVHGEASGQCQVVIGVGVNVAMPKRLGGQIDQPWTDLNTIAGKSVDKNLLLAEIMNELIMGLNKFERNGFSEFVDEWQSYHAMQQHKISLQVGSKVVDGVCHGVDASGALLLDTDAGLQAFHGGEVSIQRPL
ncbi:MAG: bifunctional biotin--[acetyl-CoA-carboxylase] synthetase/biotin operon repressor [Gammaproteobacteria bacterium]|nr:MAG: bifunctional biotin--[acetyl-CoA-carboxylase] synthetase/biotin operon repressor [Gammaproteobacteria bacterium]